MVAPRRDHVGVGKALDRYPGLALKPSRAGDLVVSGHLDFRAATDVYGEVSDTFAVEIRVPKGFPLEVPKVWETGGRLPDTYHLHDDKSRCLGSPLVTELTVRKHPTLLGFIEKLLIPYLYGYVIFQRTGTMPFGELDHGYRGILDEYRGMLHAASDEQCLDMLRLAGLKRRIANKKSCPCGSGRRTGRCHNRVINRLRERGSRLSFRLDAAYLGLKLKALAEDRKQTLRLALPAIATAAA